MNACNNPSISRRRFLWHTGGGLGGVALSHLLGAAGLLAGPAKPRPEFNGGLHHRAKAKRVIQLFMNGGASQIDTFDMKPGRPTGGPFRPIASKVTGLQEGT